MKDLNLDNNQITVSGEKPLYVLKYDALRIAWRLLWPTLPGLIIFSLAAFYQFETDSAPTIIFVKAAGFILLIATLYVTYDMVMLDGIYLYSDRIVKRYRTGKEKIVLLKDARVSITSSEMIGQMFFTREENKSKLISYIKDVYIDAKLAKPNDVKAFKEALAQVSGQNVADLKRRYFKTKLMKTKKW
jgi:hypothetical protein